MCRIFRSDCRVVSILAVNDHNDRSGEAVGVPIERVGRAVAVKTDSAKAAQRTFRRKHDAKAILAIVSVVADGDCRRGRNFHVNRHFRTVFRSIERRAVKHRQLAGAGNRLCVDLAACEGHVGVDIEIADVGISGRERNRRGRFDKRLFE